MANRFWVLGTGTLDASDTTHWSATTGGAGGASVPTTGDTVTFDASSGGGTVTVASAVSGLSLANFVAGAFTGTIDWATNGPINMTFTTAMTLSGTGARKFLLGSGTFTFTATTNVTVFDLTTTTNLDPTSDFSGASYTVTATSALNRTFAGGGRSYGPLTVSTNSSRGPVIISGANTFSSISLAAGTTLGLPPAVTTTVSNAITWTGTSSLPISISNGNNNVVATLSIASGTSTIAWGSLYGITATGGGTFNATNSLDGGRTSGWSITAPSGGGGGQRVISG